MEQTAPQNSLGKAFAGSLLTHGVLIGLLVTSGLWNLTRDRFGSQHASSGSVGVDVVKSIPIPRRDAPQNPLANDTKAIAPQAPQPVTPQAKVKAPLPDAIPIPSRFDKTKKLSKREEAKMVYRPPVEYKTNQLYSPTAPAAVSPMFGTHGSGGIDVGPASVLGTRFGAYVDLMTDRIAQHWNRADVHASPSQKCLVTFTIARNGTVSDVQVTQPSGNYVLDNSAKRAILDASPLPELPRELGKDSAKVDLWFQLK
jgi:protein TonB